MQATLKALHELTAGDLMTPEVVALPRHLSLSVAANLLSHAQVTGAPVVDEQGACIGVISGTDFIRWARNHRQEDANFIGDSYACSDWQMVEVDTEEGCSEVVGRYMTPDPVMVHRDASIHDLARQMLNAHIHRVIVVDDADRPIGIVSTTDILAALATYPE